MEEKQLDFNAPLLSVRRFMSTAAFGIEESTRVEKSTAKKPSLPSYKPELKSGPVRNAGTVPFLWEQIPGRPKDRSGLCQHTPELAHLTANLPPGKIVDSKRPSSAKDRVDKEPEVLTLSKLTQADNLTDHADDFSSNGNGTNSDRSKRSVIEEHTSNLKDFDDDAFSDALDTLSHTESFFMNCSLTGLSAPDSPELKPFTRTMIDPQARNFMMDRFLPAAKAMASEGPQFASRKQPVAREPLRSMRQVKNGVGDGQPLTFGGDKQPLHYQYKPDVAPQHSMDEEEKDSSDDDDDEDFDDTDNLTVKVCGIVPRFCLKNSLCLLNPVPGMKIRSRMPSSSIRRKVTTHIKKTGPENLCGPDPETWEAVYKHKLLCGLQPSLTSDDGRSKPTSKSNQLICWSDPQTPDGSSPYRPSSSDGITPYQKEASQSLFHEGMSFLGVPKQGKNRKAVGLTMYGEGQDDNCRMLSHQSSKQGSSSSSPVTEKTLFMDSVQMMETSNSRPSSSDIRELMSSTEKDSNVLLESERFDKCFKERDSLQPKIFKTSESNPLSCSEGSILSLSMNNKESFRHDNDLVQEANSSECSNVLANRILDFNRPEPLEEDQGNSYAISLQSPCPPPLPRSPSESWLCRTLPSVSSMNPSSRSYLGIQFRSRKHLLKESPVYPKWETIVKTSNAQHKDLRFSEELKITASHASGT